MVHPLTLEYYLPFILVSNISPTLNETSAKDMLTQLFADQRAPFGVPNNIIIGLPSDGYNFENDIPNSLRAYVKYEDYKIHGRVARHFNDTISFGRRLKMENILVNNYRSPTFLSRFIGMEDFRPEGDGGYLDSLEINGYECLVFSHLDYLIDISTPINQGNINLNQTHENSILDNRTTQETEYFSLPQNSFKCKRCFKIFGSSQNEFESHVEQCKLNENTSMSYCIREAKCTIYQFKLLQTSTKNVRFLPCGHVLHKECLDKMLAINYKNIKECPNCKQKIPDDWTGEIYLD